MLLIFCKKIQTAYIAKVGKNKKKDNNSPYKLFGEVLRVVIVPAVMVHPQGSYIPNFMTFCRCAQCFHHAAALRHLFISLDFDCAVF